MTAPLPTTQAPGFHHRRFGDVFVTALLDGYIDIPAAIYRHADAQEAARLQRLAFGPPQPRSAINAFLVRTVDRTVLIDAGAGTAFGATSGHLAASLAAAEVTPEQIDTVLFTHLHPDHVGGAISDDGQAIFAKADIVVPQAEADWWLDEARAANAPEAARDNFQNARRIADAYAGRFHRLDAGSTPPGIAAHPLPGHTPGHTGFMVGTGADRVLIWGDIFHLPALQVRRPEIGVLFDIDPDQAQATRRATLDMAASERLLIAGMHMDFPGFAHIDRTVDGYCLVWSAWAPEM